MHPRLVRQSANALAHPVTLVAAALLMFNAAVAQRLWPSWWTGKWGDVAWLIVAPLLGAMTAGLLLPRRVSERLGGALGLATPALAYALVKSWPLANAWTVATLRGFGFEPKLTLDPTDLIALPALVLTVWIWRRASSQPGTGRARRATGALLAAVALLADSPAPLFFGANCVVDRDGVLSVYSQVEEYAYFRSPDRRWIDVYTSTDGGATWTAGEVDASDQTQELACARPQWPLSVGSAPGAQLYQVPGQGIYVSEDEGQTLRLEQKLEQVYSALVYEPNGALIVAAGEEGIFVRAADGSWTQTPPDGK